MEEGWKHGGFPGRGDAQTESQITSQKLPFRGGRERVPGRRKYIAQRTSSPNLCALGGCGGGTLEGFSAVGIHSLINALEGSLCPWRRAVLQVRQINVQVLALPRPTRGTTGRSPTSPNCSVKRTYSCPPRTVVLRRSVLSSPCQAGAGLGWSGRSRHAPSPQQAPAGAPRGLGRLSWLGRAG